MPRYISKARAFKKTVRKAKTQLINTPQGPEVTETSPPLIAFFEQGGTTPKETALALERFKFSGLAEKENPARRLSVYDTDEQAKAHGWGADFKSEVEAVLDAGQCEFYFKVVAEKAPKPWPKYDETDVDDIADLTSVLGIDPAIVLAYERENLGREAVLSAFDEAEVDDAGVVIEA